MNQTDEDTTSIEAAINRYAKTWSLLLQYDEDRLERPKKLHPNAPTVAPWIAEQSWHPEQKTSTAPDGALRLEFPVADFRELLDTILSHGAAVQVVEPVVLKELVGREIDKMAKNYFFP